jgi:hypothetical protein
MILFEFINSHAVYQSDEFGLLNFNAAAEQLRLGRAERTKLSASLFEIENQIWTLFLLI